MTFRYVNKIRLGDDFQIRKQNSTWRWSFRYVNKIRLGDVFQIRKQNSGMTCKQNSTWRGILDT